jgi:hypothetical protein
MKWLESHRWTKIALIYPVQLICLGKGGGGERFGKSRTKLIMGQTNLYNLVIKEKTLHHFLKSQKSNPIHLQNV